jgi:aldose 1-epimerase
MISASVFGKMPDGREVVAYTLTNRFMSSVKILNLGGIIAELNIPDRDEKIADIVCGFDTVEGYLTGGGYQGALVGRYGNRIANGRFTLNGTEYILAKNEGGLHHLHGGDEGFNAKIWTVETVERDDENQLLLEYVSEDGEEGYPGRLKASVTYTFGDNNVLRIRYEAFSNKDTVCNLTNHTYFNLAGYAAGDIGEHRLYIDSDFITEIDDEFIPTGVNLPVKGTKFDFNRFKAMKEPYDHNYILKNDGKLKKAAEVREPRYGRRMEVLTDLPGMQLYTSNMMNGAVPFKGGIQQKPHTAFCMETQFAPDSPNQPDFPSCTLHAGDIYDYTTEFRFGVI